MLKGMKPVGKFHPNSKPWYDDIILKKKKYCYTQLENRFFSLFHSFAII